MQQKTKKLILALFISFLMITSIAGFIVSPEETNNNQDQFNKKTYKNVEFTNINNKWVTYINNVEIPLTFDPTTIEEQNLVNIADFNSAEKLYFSSDQNETNNFIVYQELNVLAQVLKPKSINSCYKESKECEKLPLKTCEDAKDLNKVIIVKKQNLNEIKYQNNCLELKGPEIEIIKLIDLLILSLITS